MIMDRILPFFSVIIPVYNVSRFLPMCVESIRKQTFDNFELILVDDGSTDGSSDLCDEYMSTDKRIHVIHIPNGGVVNARITGVGKARGEYIVCVDSDDWLDDHYLKKCKSIIDAHHVDVISCGYSIYKNGRNRNIYSKYKTGKYDREDIITEIYPVLVEDERGSSFTRTVWAKCFKKSLYQPIQEGIDTRLTVMEDVPCSILIIAHAKDMFILNECLYYYRVNEDSQTRNDNPIPWEEPLLVADNIRDGLRDIDWNFKNQIERIIVHGLFNVISSHFIFLDSYKEKKKTITTIINNYKEYPESINRVKYGMTIRGRLGVELLKKRWYLPFLIYGKARVKL